MPEAFTDSQGNRVIIRHRGPAGKGLPPGGTTGQIYVKASNTDFDGAWANPPDGTGAVTGPASAINGHFALFDGTTGKLIKDSGKSLTYFATASALAGKVSKVVGKGLSTNDYTTPEKTLLASSWNAAGYRGSFDTIETINGTTFDPLPSAGDYCLITAESALIELVLWDAANSAWVPFSIEPESITGADIAALLFKTGETWDKETCRVYTDTEKAQLAAHQSLINSLGMGDYARAHGGVKYFDLTGTPIALSGTSDGLTNTYKVDVATSLVSVVTSFDNGGSDNAQLRYTASPAVTLNVSVGLTITGSDTGTFVVAIAKNGAVIPETRMLVSVNNVDDTEVVSLNAIVTMLSGEYLEVFMGRTTGTLDPTILALSLTAIKIP